MHTCSVRIDAWTGRKRAGDTDQMTQILRIVRERHVQHCGNPHSTKIQLSHLLQTIILLASDLSAAEVN